MKPELIEKARSLFADPQMTVSQASKELGVSYYVATKLKKQLDEESAAPEPEPESDEEDDDNFELNLNVPSSRADDIWGAFTVEEKMFAIQCVIQDRMDTILEPE